MKCATGQEIVKLLYLHGLHLPPHAMLILYPWQLVVVQLAIARVMWLGQSLGGLFSAEVKLISLHLLLSQL